VGEGSVHSMSYSTHTDFLRCQLKRYCFLSFVYPSGSHVSSSKAIMTWSASGNLSLRTASVTALGKFPT